DRAGAAGRLLRVAAPAAVEDQPVRQHRPVLLREQVADDVLDLDRVLLGGPAEAADQAAEMRVDGDAGNAERVAEDHVRGLPAGAGELHQLLELVRYDAVVLVDE